MCKEEGAKVFSRPDFKSNAFSFYLGERDQGGGRGSRKSTSSLKSLHQIVTMAEDWTRVKPENGEFNIGLHFDRQDNLLGSSPCVFLSLL